MCVHLFRIRHLYRKSINSISPRIVISNQYRTFNKQLSLVYLGVDNWIFNIDIYGFYKMFITILIKSFVPLYDNCRCLAAAYAKRCQSVFRISSFHFMKKSCHDSCAACTNRMTECNCASVNINVFH